MIPREQVLEWFEQAGSYANNCDASGKMPDNEWNGLRAMHFARLVWNSAIERAAEACRKVSPKYPLVGHQYICGSHDAAFDCVDAIRSLKEPTDD